MIMKIAIIHYDISMQTGAQRLVLGMGNSLKKLGHEVAYFTAIYDEKKAFEEFRTENVIVSNGKLDYFGKFRAITAYRESKEMMKTGIDEFKPDLFVFSSNYYLADKYKPSMIYCLRYFIWVWSSCQHQNMEKFYQFLKCQKLLK